jgi:hypothetical protein
LTAQILKIDRDISLPEGENLKRRLMLNVHKSVTSMLILMIALTLTSMLTTHSVYAQGETSANVNPSQVFYDATNGTVGTLFNITVTVTGLNDSKVWQVKMGFNDSIINVTRWYEPTWDPTYVFYGMTTLPVPGPVKPTYNPGWLGVGAALFPAPSVGGGFTGNGTLCIIAFNITATPPAGQNYTCNFNIAYPSDTFWIKTGESTKRSFTTYNGGQYTIIPELAPLMILATLTAATIVAARARKRIRKV